jgi:hypothetical protein
MSHFRHNLPGQRRDCSESRFRYRPRLESLETRLTPANVFVVPVSVPADATHFYSLTNALANRASGDTVTIEPGANPDQLAVTITTPNLTIQGDPNVPGSILPSYDLMVNAPVTRLANLHLGLVTIGAVDLQISRSLVDTVFDRGGATGRGAVRIDQNVITGSIFLFGNSTPGQSTGDVVQDNLFQIAHLAVGGAALQLTSASDSQILNNRIVGVEAQPAIGISSSLNVTVANNVINVRSPSGIVGAGIRLANNVAGYPQVLSAVVRNNAIDAGSLATGISVEPYINTGANFTVRIEGNDLRGNAVGAAIVTGGGDLDSQGIDLGGGTTSLGTSLGGNDFRSFSTIGTLEAAAIVLRNAPISAIVPAAANIFHAGIDPNFVIDDAVDGSASGNGQIDTSGALTNGQGFVQTLYNNLLGRTGTLNELNSWVNLLNSSGQRTVVNSLLQSPEALGRIVDDFYLRFLGRTSDTAGRNGWISFLQSGGTEEQVETLFLTSPEYINHINTDYVQSLYINFLGRTGTSSELAAWNNSIRTLGLAGIAAGFTGSAENHVHAVISFFEAFLHRTPSVRDASAIAANGDILALESLVLSGPEFFANG